MNLQSSFFVRHIYSMVVPALPLTASSAFAMVVMMALRFLPAFRKERAASIFGSMDEVPNLAFLSIFFCFLHAHVGKRSLVCLAIV